MITASATPHRCLTAIVAQWWKNWTGNRAGVAELDKLDAGAMNRIARDVGVESPELRALAGKWPDSANLLRASRSACLFAALFLALALGSADAAESRSPAAQRGLIFVRVNCAQCHAIDRISASPLKIAPPFRLLSLRYPVENLAEAFAEGIVTGHPTMPEFQLDPGQIGDLIAYLKSLER